MRGRPDRFQTEAPDAGWHRPNGQRNRRSDLPKFHTIKAVAESADVSARTVRRWIASGALIAHRRGGVVQSPMPTLEPFGRKIVMPKPSVPESAIVAVRQ